MNKIINSFLIYKEIEQAKDIKFGFNKNNKLIFIQFEPKEKIEVQAFLKAFSDIKFKPVSQVVLGMVDNTNYILQGEQNGYVIAGVRRSTLGSIFGNTGGLERNTQTQSNETLIGKVVVVQFVSKSLENNQNTDVLK